jgi:hypothetical protein
MKEKFEELKFRPATLDLIALMDGILSEYAAQGYVLTVRQLYYQMVARDYIPNNMRSYKRLVGHCANARKAGLLNWAYLEDTARRKFYPASWKDPADIIEAAAQGFRVDRWQGQPERVLVMIEKEALSGVFSGPCDEHHVRLYPNKGYTSLSYIYTVGKMIRRMVNFQHLDVHVIYFGDHDPSGMDMDRDIQERLGLFSSWTPFGFTRIALTMDQVEEYDPPPDPAKLSDSRAGAYVAKYGYDSWELDALTPQVLTKLLEEEIALHVDQDIWDATMAKEKEMREELQTFADEYNKEE